MKKFVLPILLFSFILFLLSCDSDNRPARGFEDEIFVVADSAEYEELRTAMESAFEKIIYTPQPEKIFTLKRIDVSEVAKYKRRKNIVIVAPLNSETNASVFLSAIVDSSVEEKIKSDPNFIVYKDGLWAKNQLVAVLSAQDIQQLEFKIFQNADNLLYTFQKKSDERLYNSLYNPTYEQKHIEGKFLKDYGWIIYVQADFKVALDKPEDNFVWLRRSPGSNMERWLFVYWIENASPEYLNADSIKIVRNRVTKKFYQTRSDSSYVVVAKNYFTTNEVNFNDKYAILTQGLWELNIKGMGGPFVNYTFYDEATKRFYMIDGSVFAPKYYKRNLIQQMDVTLQSFRTDAELTEERREDLLDEVEE